MKKIFLGVLICLISCEQIEKDDLVSKVDKSSSIETTIEIKNELQYKLLITKHKVWLNNKIDKEIIKIDTLKSLGFTREEAENSNGEIKEVIIPKEYEIFITVK